jgi:hypothetical protein
VGRRGSDLIIDIDAADATAVGKLDGVFGDLSEAAGENLRPRSVPALLTPADENALTN